MMTEAEIAFLEKGLRPTDVMWEWGAGASSPWIARHVRRLTTVEHDRMWAQTILPVLPNTASLVWCPADRYPGPDEDGDDNDYWNYVRTYSGEGITAVLLDGRARVACARRVAETATFGPHPDMRIWLHDADRPEYERIWLERGKDGEPDRPGYLHIVDQVERLMLLKPRL